MCRTVCFRHLGPRVPRRGRRSDRRRVRQEPCVSGVIVSTLTPMPSADLRPCPFCASTHLTVATLGHEQTQFVVVACSGCGATGPRANVTDPSGHAEFLWNQRFGVVLSISPSHRA
jgi:hypothetical protein